MKRTLETRFRNPLPIVLSLRACLSLCVRILYYERLLHYLRTAATRDALVLSTTQHPPVPPRPDDEAGHGGECPAAGGVFQPAGAECNWPKQWQSGLRPWAMLTLIPTTKRSKSASVPAAPQRAVEVGISATAMARSASGSKRPIGPAREEGTPKSTMVCREPERSASLVLHNVPRFFTSSRMRSALASSTVRLVPPRTLSSSRAVLESLAKPRYWRFVPLRVLDLMRVSYNYRDEKNCGREPSGVPKRLRDRACRSRDVFVTTSNVALWWT